MTLTATLDRILRWITINQPSYASTFLSGLTREEIDFICRDLPGFITEDIYELYQWRNGTQEEYWRWMHVPPYLFYQPLQDAVDYFLLYLDCCEDIEKDIENKYIENNDFLFNQQYLFPFECIEKDMISTLLFSKKTESSPVVVFYPLQVDLVFLNLQIMFDMVAEGLETGVYYLNTENKIDGDKADIQKLFYKYNPPSIDLIFW